MISENNNNVNDLFNRLQGEWDMEEPPLGHQERFLDLLEGRKKKRRVFNWRVAIPVAAAVVILLGIFTTFKPEAEAPQDALAGLSPKAKETQMYFASVIEKELAKIEKENTPETKKLIHDALSRMEELETDYNKLTEELIKKGENRQIIHAMITNLQTRISFLEEVMTQIDNIKQLKQKYNEHKTI